MNYKSIFPIVLVIFTSIVLFSNICFAQDDESEYTTVFSADRLEQHCHVSYQRVKCFH